MDEQYKESIREKIRIGKYFAKLKSERSLSIDELEYIFEELGWKLLTVVHSRLAISGGYPCAGGYAYYFENVSLFKK